MDIDISDIDISDVEAVHHRRSETFFASPPSQPAESTPRLDEGDASLRARQRWCDFREFVNDPRLPARSHTPWAYRRNDHIPKTPVSWEQEKPAPPRRFLDPPPLAPYVTADKRFFPPEPDPYRRDPRYPKGTPAVDFRPIQVPAPSWVPALGTIQPKKPRKESFSQTGSGLISKDDCPVNISQRPPPSQRTDTDSTHSSIRMQRTTSNTSHLSDVSSRSLDAVSFGSSEVSKNGVSLANSAPSTSDLTDPSLMQKKKRSRVLMTSIQQKHLGALWKKTKFPNSQEREDMAQAIGLTPRQVQVWFQNQRQKLRKQMQSSGGAPEGGDPRDYANLSHSDHVRQYAIDNEDRVSHWAASSGTGSLWSVATPHSAHLVHPPQPRILHPSQNGMPLPVPIPITISGPSAYRSPPRPLISPVEPSWDIRDHEHHPSPQSLSGRGGMWEPRDTGDPPFSATSPAFGVGGFGVLSPPLTSTAFRFPSSEQGHVSFQRPRKSSSYEDLRRRAPSPLLPEIARPCHLPPELAKLAITRPFDRRDTDRGNILPSLQRGAGTGMANGEDRKEARQEVEEGKRRRSNGLEMTRARSESGTAALPSLRSMFG